MLNKNIETFIGCDCDYEEADIVLFGAPFDSTTSFRPGTRFASKAIRSESFGIETYSPYQNADLEDIRAMDSGDLELPFGNTVTVLSQIENRTDQIVQDGKVPLMIGGEHLVTLGAIRAIAKEHPELHVIHFDAHADLRDDYMGEQLSHACVMRRVWEIVGDHRIHQFGIRSGERSEFAWANEHMYQQPFRVDGVKDIISQLKGKPVYVTIDLDVLDPSIFPGTGTPEAGGVSFIELLEAVLCLKGLNIVGCDVNELSPVYDQSGVSTAVACKIIRELLLVVNK